MRRFIAATLLLIMLAAGAVEAKFFLVRKLSFNFTLTGATGCTAVTPKFTFTLGTVRYRINGGTWVSLTSGVEANIALTVGQTIEYACSNWNKVSVLDINGDKVTGNISSWTLPSSLAYFAVYSTSVSGDISDWVLPSSLAHFYVHSTSVSGDITGWVLPSSLAYFTVYSTSVSGDISDWVLPSSLAHFYVNSTSVDYDTSSGAFTGITNVLTKIDFDNCSLTQSQVDNVLADCVASGITGAKTLEVGDNNAAPSAAGLANRTILLARGWTVKVTS